MIKLDISHIKYLDLACGTGQVLFDLQSKFDKSIGLDHKES